MKKYFLKKGYIISITSYKSINEDYKTCNVLCDTEDQAKMLIKFAKLFKSKHLNEEPGIGNISYPTPIKYVSFENEDNFLSKEISQAKEKLINFGEENSSIFDDTSLSKIDKYIYLRDLSEEILDCSDYYWSRAYCSSKVHFFEQAMQYEEIEL